MLRLRIHIFFAQSKIKRLTRIAGKPFLSLAERAGFEPARLVAYTISNRAH